MIPGGWHFRITCRGPHFEQLGHDEFHFDIRNRQGLDLEGEDKRDSVKYLKQTSFHEYDLMKLQILHFLRFHHYHYLNEDKKHQLIELNTLAFHIKLFFVLKHKLSHVGTVFLGV